MFMFSLFAVADTAVKPNTGFGTFDEGLIMRVGENDMDALRIIYDATNSELYGYALSIVKNTHDAQDVLQETYLKLRASAHLYKPHGKPMAWLCTITKNLCLMKLRENGRAVSIDAFEQPADTMEDFSFSDAVSTEDKLVLEAAMSILTDEERQIVMLHAVTGLKHREICGLVDLPLATVLSKYNRSLKKLKKYLEEGSHS